MPRCSKCKVATYCSTECQKSDWKNHKAVCTLPLEARGPVGDIYYSMMDCLHNPAGRYNFEEMLTKMEIEGLCAQIQGNHRGQRLSETHQMMTKSLRRYYDEMNVFNYKALCDVAKDIKHCVAEYEKMQRHVDHIWAFRALIHVYLDLGHHSEAIAAVKEALHKNKDQMVAVKLAENYCRALFQKYHQRMGSVERQNVACNQKLVQKCTAVTQMSAFYKNLVIHCKNECRDRSCTQQGVIECSVCKTVKYCSEAHRDADAEHKEFCEFSQIMAQKPCIACKSLRKVSLKCGFHATQESRPDQGAVKPN